MKETERPPNRLSRESSPYLLLHARNPVDWYPWGDEAFERARREDKPIFLSVGYSTCYWCHVMERESFSDEAVARQLNEGFVSIKLDREERPELDEIYMTATQLLTRAGGWPNSLFLTHDLEPFFAGTYFPPDDRYGRPGFPRVLAAVREAWDERRDGVREQAAALAEVMRREMGDSAALGALPAAEAVRAAQASLAQRFDPTWGGFGGAPKFPSPSSLFFLLDCARQGDEEARTMLAVTLERMARGGLHDQLAGGFHRYSTDAEWLVPHFEKMLYDNASLALLYAEAAQGELAAGGETDERAEFERVARATFDFVLAELTGEHGAFLSAIDAETDGHEGAYYTWTAEELRAALAGDDEGARLLGALYGFDGAPNFERHGYVLHLPRPWREQARALGFDEATLRARVEPARRALLAARAGRPRPLTDDKVLTDWNGLMIAALARGGRLLGEARYVEAARGAAEFVLARLRDESGELRHAWRGGQARVPALLDDYAFLISGLLALHAAQGAARWLDEALRLQAEQDRRLGDEAGGGWFSAGVQPHLLVRARAAHDGALPSGNGVAAWNLLELHARTGDPAWRERATRAVCAFGRAVEQFPLAHVTLVRALARLRREGDVTPASGSQAPAASALEAQARGVVEAEAVFDAHAAGTWKPLRVELRVRAGWHVNANPASQPFLVATRVSGAGVRALKYPPGRELRSDIAPEALRVYEGHVRVEGEIEVGADGPPLLDVTVQPCDAARCLPAVTLRLTPRPAST